MAEEEFRQFLKSMLLVYECTLQIKINIHIRDKNLITWCGIPFPSLLPLIRFKILYQNNSITSYWICNFSLSNPQPLHLGHCFFLLNQHPQAGVTVFTGFWPTEARVCNLLPPLIPYSDWQKMDFQLLERPSC